MNNSVNYKKTDSKDVKVERKKRQPLSLSASRLCIKRYNTVILTFT